MAKLHNITFYAGRDQFPAVRDFYAGLGLPVVFEEPGHICCFDAGDGVAVCVHEAEPHHAAGSRELFFWTDEGGGETRLTDPLGNRVRLHARRP